MTVEITPADCAAAADFMDECNPHLGDCGMKNTVHLALREAFARHRMASNIENGWITHKGGECPVAYNVLVHVRLRDGTVEGAQSGAYWQECLGDRDYWLHEDHSSDIVAYRLAQASARHAEIDFDDTHDDDCWNCGGGGFVSDCFEEWACLHPEDGCDLCTRRCDVCNQRPSDSDAKAKTVAAQVRPMTTPIESDTLEGPMISGASVERLERAVWDSRVLPSKGDIARLLDDNKSMREALEKAAGRFEHCADLIASSFNIPGTLRAERTIKAKHFALETRQALARAHTGPAS